MLSLFLHLRLRLSLFFSLSLISSLSAQESNSGAWYMYLGNQPFHQRWNWHNELQYRNYNLAGDLEQIVLRTGIGYNLSENNNNVLIGYGFFYSEPYIAGTDEKTETTEHRLFQQYLTRQKFGRFNLQHRYRIEERFLEEEFKMRYRYFLSLHLPLNKASMEKGTIYLSVYNEIFLQNKPPVFDRDRIYGALGYMVSPYIRIETGWMTQLFTSHQRGQFQLALFNNIPFKP